MENFAVDLDKVLDDFENDEVENCVDVHRSDLGKVQVRRFGHDSPEPGGTGFAGRQKLPQPYLVKDGRSSRYRVPYDQGDKFDMSGADFGPSPPKTYNNCDKITNIEVERSLDLPTHNHVRTYDSTLNSIHSSINAPPNNLRSPLFTRVDTSVDAKSYTGTGPASLKISCNESFVRPVSTEEFHNRNTETENGIARVIDGDAYTSPVSDIPIPMIETDRSVENVGTNVLRNHDEFNGNSEINNSLQTTHLRSQDNQVVGPESDLTESCTDYVRVAVDSQDICAVGDRSKMESSSEKSNFGMEAEGSHVDETAFSKGSDQSLPCMKTPADVAAESVSHNVVKNVATEDVSDASFADGVEKAPIVNVLPDSASPQEELQVLEVAVHVGEVDDKTDQGSDEAIAVTEEAGEKGDTVAIGFSDVPSVCDDVDDEEMDKYLDSYDDSGSKDGLLRDDGLTGHHQTRSPSKSPPCPPVSDSVSVDPNLDSAVTDKSNILPSPVVSNFRSQLSSGSKTLSVVEGKDRPSEQFSGSEIVSTPRDDPGFSCVPGFCRQGAASSDADGGSFEQGAVVTADKVNSVGSDSTAFTGFSPAHVQSDPCAGARPKEASLAKPSRPNTLIGLSRPTFPLPSPVGTEHDRSTITSDVSSSVVDSVETLPCAVVEPGVNTHDTMNQSVKAKCMMTAKQLNVEIKDQHDQQNTTPVSPNRSDSVNMPNNLNLTTKTGGNTLHTNNFDGPMQTSEKECIVHGLLVTNQVRPTRPSSFPSASAPSPQGKQKRPTSLNLPPRTDFSPQTEEPVTVAGGCQPEELANTLTEPAAENEAKDTAATRTPIPESTACAADDNSPVEEGAAATVTEPVSLDLPDLPLQPQSTGLVSQLGKVAPIWVPDSEAPNCMQCEARFTFTRRRHHCRACGKVFCSACCNLKSKLAYMDHKEARVCQLCHVSLLKNTTEPPSPGLGADYPSVSSLKQKGSQRKGEPKSVMFSDGIRPGGDLTELDGSVDPRPIMRKTGRTAKKVERSAPPDGADYSIEDDPDPEKLLPQLKNVDADPVVFAINKNLFVLVKIVNLDCCVSRICWCFTTRGMNTVGQEEIVIVLDYQPDEKTVPRDIFCHLNRVYEEAGKGNTVSDLGHTIFGQSFLGSKDHGGFLYIRPTFQCLQKLILPEPPYIFGILLQKWETPWAKVFPIRLMLRLGAEYRYYPCPLISVRFRNSAYMEIGHTIMNLLADFRSYQYMLQQIKGVAIHMEDKITYINFPRNRYDEVMKVINNSNDHVMALGASFSTEADSHLVCIQNDEGNYQTQAINIQNKPRKVTGASFVVFNGALKSSSGLTAKSSIVEDGLMVQITPGAMVALKQSLRDMKDYVIGCGNVDAPQPEEIVMVQWVEDDKNVNVGVKSPIDRMPMDGIKSIRVQNTTDYVGETRTIRWTEVFFIQEDVGTSRSDPVDVSRLAETLNQAASVALVPHLDKLKEANITKIGLRVTVDAEKVGYEIGSNGEKLPSNYMNDLDNELIPVIHTAVSNSHDNPITLELIFHILE